MHRFIAFTILICTTVLCGNTHAQTEKLIVIEHADSLVGRTIGDQQVQELIGNVRFSQDRVRVSCERAIQFKASGNVELLGNVIVQDDSLIMRFPKGMYFRDERRAVAYDSVHLFDGNVTLTSRFGEYQTEPRKAFFWNRVVAQDAESRLSADSLTYFRTNGRMIALGEVEIRSFPDHLTIRGGHFESFKKEEYGRMTLHPVLVRFDTSRDASRRIDTLVVRSRVMESYRGDSVKRLIATDSVEILRGEMASVAGRATFYTEGDSIQLRLLPLIWYEQTQVSGDSINVYLRGRKLDVVRVFGNALAVSQSDSARLDRFDQITGEEMTLRFGVDGLDHMEVNRRAISVYHLYEDAEPNGLNRTSGDRIELVWASRKLNAIKVFGGVEGQYVPENLTAGREREYAVPGFQWRAERPAVRDSDFRFSHITKKRAGK